MAKLLPVLLCSAITLVASAPTIKAASFSIYQDRASFEAAIENQRIVDFTGLAGSTFRGTTLTAGELNLTGPAAPVFSDTGVITTDGTAPDPFGTAFSEAALVSVENEPTRLSFGSTTAFGADFESLQTEFASTFFLVDGEAVTVPDTDPSSIYDGFFGFTSDTPFSSLSLVDGTMTPDRLFFDNVSFGDALPLDPPDQPVDPDPDPPFRIFTDRAAFEQSLTHLTNEDFADAPLDTDLTGRTTMLDDFDFFTSGSLATVASSPVFGGSDAPVLELSLDSTTDFASFAFENPVLGFGADVDSLAVALGGTALNFLDQTASLATLLDTDDYSGFFGIISDVAFSEISFTNTVSDRDFISIDNVTTGKLAVIPLPPAGLLLLAGVGLLASAGVRRGRDQSRGRMAYRTIVSSLTNMFDQARSTSSGDI